MHALNQPEEVSLKDKTVTFRALYDWADILEDREIAEILFAFEYTQHYKHGTSGHLSHVVLTKLFQLLTTEL